MGSSAARDLPREEIPPNFSPGTKTGHDRKPPPDHDLFKTHLPDLESWDLRVKLPRMSMGNFAGKGSWIPCGCSGAAVLRKTGLVLVTEGGAYPPAGC